MDLTDLADGDQELKLDLELLRQSGWYGAPNALPTRRHARLAGAEPLQLDPRLHVSIAAASGLLYLTNDDGSLRFATYPSANVASDPPYLPPQTGNHCAPLALTAMMGYEAGTLQQFLGFRQELARLATAQEEHPLAIPLFANGDLDRLQPDSLVHNDSGMYTGAVLSAWLAVQAGYYLTSVDTDARGTRPTAPLVPALRTLAQSLSVSAFLVHKL